MYTGVAPRKKCKVKIAKANEYAIHFHYTQVWEDEVFTHLCIAHCNKKEIKEVIRSTIKNLSDKYTKVKLIKIERKK